MTASLNGTTTTPDSSARLCAFENAREVDESSELDDRWSARSNPSVSSYNSSTREMHRRAIASAYFGPSSNDTEVIVAETAEELEKRQRNVSDNSHASTCNRSQRHSETDKDRIEEDTSREERRQNRLLFDELVHFANTRQPVQFERFKRRSLRTSGKSSRSKSFNDEAINSDLLEAYVAYSKSIGHEPKLELDPSMLPIEPLASPIDHDEDDEDERFDVDRVSFIHDRASVREYEHWWTKLLGTRYSKRRGCVQFWTWLGLGVGVVLWLGLSLSSLQLNEVLHLDAFTVHDVAMTADYTFLHFRERVDFYLTYKIETRQNSSSFFHASSFNALLLTEHEYQKYTKGEPYKYIPAGSTLRTTAAYLPRTYITNQKQESMYFLLQPCYLARNPTVDFCHPHQLPATVSSSAKVYMLHQEDKMDEQSTWDSFNATYLSVNPMPLACHSSGWRGGSSLLLFVPYVLITIFGLRVFQMLWHGESWAANLARMYRKELNVPEKEVDYWQPLPWDRKVPKTKCCGPCCWTKVRRPFEPFYTWWRHENYFTWIFFPYRNEQLSRSERLLIVVCSLYITFYVLFVIVMIRDSWGQDLPIFTSVVIYALLMSILPSAAKALFKELFKLIFRQRRTYFRAQVAVNGTTVSGFSYRLAFLLQVLVVLLLTLAQAPIFYIWAFRSCLFLETFVKFGVLAAIMRLSVMGLAQDFVWYGILKTWGWQDLCPYCTERLKHCDCFNDELLVLVVERIGPKWELIRLLDDLMAKENQYAPQFQRYTAEQLRERWDVLVERAESHMVKIEKLVACYEKKRVDSLRDEQVRDVSDMALDVCSLRERKVLELNDRIELDKFEKHYDANIAAIFHALTLAVQTRRREGKMAKEVEAKETLERENMLEENRQVKMSKKGETMWVLDTPAQRLERRHEEKLQRKRAFKVLKSYKIESVSLNPEPSCQQDDAKRKPLLPKRSRPRQDLVLIKLEEGESYKDKMALEVVGDGYEDDDDEYLSDLEHGRREPLSSGAGQLGSTRTRVYSVTERPQTLFQRVVDAAFSFATWKITA